MAGERTEAATPRRLEELRAKGSIPRSQDLQMAITLLTSFVLLRSFGPELTARLNASLAHYFTMSAQYDLTPDTLPQLATSTVMLFLGLVAPIFLLIPVAGAAASLAQTGPVFSLKAASPDVNRVNPLSGLKRLFAMRALVELAKVLAKAGLLGFVIYQVYTDSMPEIIALGATDLAVAAPRFVNMAIDIGMRAGAVLFVLGALDYGYQRWEFQRSTRMSREELREEMRQTEGRPEYRARIRQRQRKIASTGRMMAMLPKADVVITNPTHIAVALAYSPGDMGAPKVLAKGAGFVAQRIREKARYHGIPLVENKPLARALYRSVDVGTEIPLDLFQAVAEVLAYIYSLRDRRRTVMEPTDG